MPNSRKELKRKRWMEEMDDSLKEQGFTGQVDWDLATHLFNLGKHPVTAAKRIAESPLERRDWMGQIIK